MDNEPDYGVDCADAAHNTGQFVGVVGGLGAGAAVGYEAAVTGVGEAQPIATISAMEGAYEVGQHVTSPVGQALGYGVCEAGEWGKEQFHDLNNYFNPPLDTTSPPANSDGMGWNTPTFMEPTHADASVGDSWSQGPTGVLNWGDTSPTVVPSPDIEIVSTAPSVSTFEPASSWDSGGSGHDSGWGGSSHDSGWGSSDTGSSSHDSGWGGSSHDSGTGMGDSSSV